MPHPIDTWIYGYIPYSFSKKKYQWICGLKHKVCLIVPYPGRPVFVQIYVQIENEIQNVRATVGYHRKCTTVLTGMWMVFQFLLHPIHDLVHEYVSNFVHYYSFYFVHNCTLSPYWLHNLLRFNYNIKINKTNNTQL